LPVGCAPHAYAAAIFFFFFQAEDGIRDRNVTGVQTCALPISSAEAKLGQYEQAIEQMKRAEDQHREQEAAYEDNKKLQQKYQKEIGRASCRERVKISV